MSDYVEGSYGWIRERADRILSAAVRANSPGADIYVWIKDVFPDTLIAEFEDISSGESTLWEFAYTVEDGELKLTQEKQVRLDYVMKKRRERPAVDREDLETFVKSPELTGPIVQKNEEKRLVAGVVLVPGETDNNGEPPLTEERIFDAANEWMSMRFMDRDHDLGPNVAEVVQSYTLPEEISSMKVEVDGVERPVPKGSWVVWSRVTDDDTWSAVKSGELQGYSLHGFKREALEALRANGASKEQLASASKAMTFAELGEDWVPGIVSFVKKPAVPMAKWMAIKAASEPGDPAGSASEASEQENRRRASGTNRGFLGWLLGRDTVGKSEETESDVEAREDEMTKEEMQKIAADAAAAAVKSALTEAGVIKEPESTEDRLARIEGMLEKVASGESSAEKGEKDEQVSVSKKDWDEMQSLKAEVNKLVARRNGAGHGEEGLDEDIDATKEEEDDEYGDPDRLERDSDGIKTKKLFGRQLQQG